MVDIGMTSYIFICFGAAMSFSTFFWGYLNSKLTEKVTILIPICFAIIAVLIGFVVEEIDMSETLKNVLVCIIGIAGGVADSGLETISAALINRIWPKQVAPLCAWRIVYLTVMCVALCYSSYISTTIVLGIFAISIAFAISLVQADTHLTSQKDNKEEEEGILQEQSEN
ncbi:hypothetical protein QTN25_010512 [Entamoeba marina]